MAFKINSKKAQDALRRMIPRRLGNFGVDDLTPDQIRDNLLAKKNSVYVQMMNFDPKSPERKRLATEFNEINEELSRVNVETKRFSFYNRDVTDILIKILKERFTKAEWEIVCKQAHVILKQREEMTEEQADEYIANGLP